MLLLLLFSAREYGNNIKYVGIQVNTTLRFQTLGYAEGIPIMDKWEDFVKQQVHTDTCIMSSLLVIGIEWNKACGTRK